MRCLESFFLVVFLTILGFQFGESCRHLLFERGEVWKLCDSVRVSITIVVGRWNANTFASKLSYLYITMVDGCGPFVGLFG